MSLPEKITFMKSTAGDCLQRLQEEDKLESCTSHSSPRQSVCASNNGEFTDRVPAKDASAATGMDVKGASNPRIAAETNEKYTIQACLLLVDVGDNHLRSTS